MRYITFISHFTDEETEALRNEVTSGSCSGRSQNLNPEGQVLEPTYLLTSVGQLGTELGLYSAGTGSHGRVWGLVH